MKHNLILMAISVLLAGCVTANTNGGAASSGTTAGATPATPAASGTMPVPTASASVGMEEQVKEVAGEGYQHVKDTAVAAGEVVKAEASEAGEHAGNLGGAMKENFYYTTDHIADWIRPNTPKSPLPIAASYCYHVYQDILCYRRPMPGWEHRLAGYQPETAEPPLPAMMQPLPKHKVDSSQLPANRVANSKPVFTQMPEKPAEVEKPAEDTSTPAAAAASPEHEQLPDPALAPQL